MCPLRGRGRVWGGGGNGGGGLAYALVCRHQSEGNKKLNEIRFSKKKKKANEEARAVGGERVDRAGLADLQIQAVPKPPHVPL